MTFQEHIVRDPAICGGQATIRGTRVLVRSVLGHLAHGESVEAILREFPSLSADDVRAVIAFAAKAAAEAEVAALWARPVETMPAELVAELDAAAALEKKYGEDVEAELRDHAASQATRSAKRASG